MTPEHRAKIICVEWATGTWAADKWPPNVTLEQMIAQAINDAVNEALLSVGQNTKD